MNTVEAYAVGGGVAAFWCEHCRQWHEYGQVVDGDHRASHCWNPKSPHYLGSYRIKLVPPLVLVPGGRVALVARGVPFTMPTITDVFAVGGRVVTVDANGEVRCI